VAAACYGGDVFVANSLGDTVSPIAAICRDTKQLKESFAAKLNGNGRFARCERLWCAAAERVRLSHFYSCSFLV